MKLIMRAWKVECLGAWAKKISRAIRALLRKCSAFTSESFRLSHTENNNFSHSNKKWISPEVASSDTIIKATLENLFVYLFFPANRTLEENLRRISAIALRRKRQRGKTFLFLYCRGNFIFKKRSLARMLVCNFPPKSARHFHLLHNFF